MLLNTPRLMLTEVSITDAPFILKLLNSKGWLQFIGDRGVKNLADAQAYIQNNFLKSYQEQGFGMYKVSLINSFFPIGLCGLVTRPSLGKIELGFALLPEYAGKGYALEAGEAMMQYAKQSLGLSEVHAITLPDNFPSQKLLEKLDFAMQEIICLEEGSEDLMLYRWVEAS